MLGLSATRNQARVVALPAGRVALQLREGLAEEDVVGAHEVGPWWSWISE